MPLNYIEKLSAQRLTRTINDEKQDFHACNQVEMRLEGNQSFCCCVVKVKHQNPDNDGGSLEDIIVNSTVKTTA